MGGFIVYTFIGVLLLVHGILKLRMHLGCTERVLARIISFYTVEGTRYTKWGGESKVNECNAYTLEYEFGGETHKIDIKTEAFLGHATEETAIYINPTHPERYRTPTNLPKAILFMLLGVVVIIHGGLMVWFCCI
ncbi:MAG: hypothetical protein K5695_02535 [Oscillospiraceae bacterium]|nr:hypothetical protein [Oscillospiraceae bacterium]